MSASVPDPSPQASYQPPAEDAPRVQLGLTDILAQLTVSAQEQVAVPVATRQELGMDGQGVEELNRRLENVTRLAGELQAELAAIEALRPPDPGGSAVP
jgi:hypothetical protein